MDRAGWEGVFIACVSHEVFFATNSVSLPLHPWHTARQLVRAEYVMDMGEEVEMALACTTDFRM